MANLMRFLSLSILVWFSLDGLHAQEEGLASYYHKRFHGKVSSSGRIHDAEELVAAHRTHPFGTFLRVTNLSNLKSVIVCVTDRGPRRKSRIVDVSYSAAELLVFISKGIVPGIPDLRYLDLIYPKMPYLDAAKFRSAIPYRMDY